MLDAVMGNIPLGAARPKREVREIKGAVLGLKKKKLPRLTKLGSKSMEVLALHLSGDYLAREIGELLGMPQAQVYQVLNDPLSEELMQHFREGQVEEIEGLMPKAIAAVSDCLVSADGRLRLQAVDRLQKLRGRGEGQDAVRTEVSVTLVDARTKFIELLKDVTPNVGAITTTPAN